MSAADRVSLSGGQLPTLHLGAPPPDHQARIEDPKRLAALNATGLLDSDAEAAFDRFTRMAARWLSTPVAAISLVDDHRQFFKSAVGLQEPWASKRETPLDHSFCQYAVSTREPLVVADAREHPFLRDNLAITALSVVAYAGVPLITSEEQVLGALCVIDDVPRPWGEGEIGVLRDLAALTITEIELRVRLNQLDALREERGKERMMLQSVLESMQESVVVTGRDGRVLLTNPAARRGRPAELTETAAAIACYGTFERDGKTPLAPDATPSQRAAAGEELRDLELVVRLPGQSETFHSVNAIPLRDGRGEIFAGLAVGRDVTEARAAARALARSESILQGILHNLPNGAVLMFDRELRYIMADGEQLLSGVGLSRERLVGRTLQEVASPQGLAVVEPLYRAALSGESGSLEMVRDEKAYALTAVPVRDGDTITAGLLMVYDITTHKRGEAAARLETESMRNISQHDELTGLYNRRGFLERGRRQLELLQEAGAPALLFFVDLNGMKQINDQLGHEQGDRALVEMAEVLRTSFRGSDLLARLGGDEFVALLPKGDVGQLSVLELRVQSDIELRNAAPGRCFQLSASIGAAVFDPAHPESIDQLLAKADALMYEQKKARKAVRCAG
jgi:diguanylate cyclase (GGDEF)-like protein